MAKKRGRGSKQGKPKMKKKGAHSGNKGKAFERQIAARMREVYDPPELLVKLEKATKEKRLKDRTVLLKRSLVRRSDQGKGAVEPDIVIRGCPCWIECEDAYDSRPLEKYAQAERDVEQTQQTLKLWPVAICHKTGEHKVGVWIALHHLVMLSDMQARASRPPLGQFGVADKSGSLNLHSKGFDLEQPVRVDLEDFLMLLRDDFERREEEAAARAAAARAS